MSLVALRYDDADDVLAGLRAPRKHLPSRLLYTGAGADLRDRLCAIDAYYPTRAELGLLDQFAAPIAQHIGPGVRVIEPGRPDPRRTRKLLHALDTPSSYVPVDIAGEPLHRLASNLRTELPGVDIQPVIADYTEPFELPQLQRTARRTVIYFPGSTIGNFEPADARRLLARLGQLAGPGRMLLLGADGTRDQTALAGAYDDDHGLAAALDKNALVELNRTRGADFAPDAFDHCAIWNPAASRIELQLISRHRQTVHLSGEPFTLAAGEPIVTEHCYKHTPAALHTLLTTAGWRPRQVFTSPITPFRLWLCEPLGSNRV